MLFSIGLPVYTPQHPKGSDFSTSFPILVFSVFDSGHPNYCGPLLILVLICVSLTISKDFLVAQW